MLINVNPSDHYNHQMNKKSKRIGKSLHLTASFVCLTKSQVCHYILLNIIESLKDLHYMSDRVI